MRSTDRALIARRDSETIAAASAPRPITDRTVPPTPGWPCSSFGERSHIMKNCKLCRYSKVCNDLPGICIWIPYLAIALLVLALGYLFVTQEVL